MAVIVGQVEPKKKKKKITRFVHVRTQMALCCNKHNNTTAAWTADAHQTDQARLNEPQYSFTCEKERPATYTIRNDYSPPAASVGDQRPFALSPPTIPKRARATHSLSDNQEFPSNSRHLKK